MKFFLDENLSPLLAEPLRAVYRGHEFGTAHDEGLRTTLDITLFGAIRERGYDAILTKDKNQHRNRDERRAIFDNGLHWVGHQMKDHKGLPGFALESSTIVAGLSFVLEDWREDPHMYFLKGLEAQTGQRLRVQRTRLDMWN